MVLLFEIAAEFIEDDCSKKVIKLKSPFNPNCTCHEIVVDVLDYRQCYILYLSFDCGSIFVFSSNCFEDYRGRSFD